MIERCPRDSALKVAGASVRLIFSFLISASLQFSQMDMNQKLLRPGSHFSHGLPWTRPSYLDPDAVSIASLLDAIGDREDALNVMPNNKGDGPRVFVSNVFPAVETKQRLEPGVLESIDSD